jgi:hypothetical protein
MYQTRKHRLKNPLGYSTAWENSSTNILMKNVNDFIPMEGNKLLPE